MVSAIIQCHAKSAGGTTEFVKGGHHFGWKSVDDMYKRELICITCILCSLTYTIMSHTDLGPSEDNGEWVPWSSQ